MIAKGGKAAQNKKRKDDLLLERSHGGLAGTVRGGSMKRERKWKEKRSKVLTSLFIRIYAKRLGGEKQRDRRRKVGEETRACYCD